LTDDHDDRLIVPITKSETMKSPDGRAFRWRVVLVGEMSVGKTSLLSQLVDHHFDGNQQPTVGANYQIYVTEIASQKIELQVWDTAGQEQYRSLGPIYYRNAVAALVVYDVTARSTFSAISAWIAAFQNVAGAGATIAIVGNKVDKDGRVVEASEGRDYATEHGFLFFEVSAMTGAGVEPMFDSVTEAIFHGRESGTSGRFAGLSPAADRRCACGL
jgi:small GTP-binding protein